MSSLALNDEEAKAVRDNLNSLYEKIEKQRTELRIQQKVIDENWTGPSRERGEEKLTNLKNIIISYLDTVETSARQHQAFLEKTKGKVFH